MKAMICKYIFFVPAVTVPAQPGVSNNQVSYIIGGIIALFILGYLIYSLMKPEKF